MDLRRRGEIPCLGSLQCCHHSVESASRAFARRSRSEPDRVVPTIDALEADPHPELRILARILDKRGYPVGHSLVADDIHVPGFMSLTSISIPPVRAGQDANPDGAANLPARWLLAVDQLNPHIRGLDVLLIERSENGCIGQFGRPIVQRIGLVMECAA